MDEISVSYCFASDSAAAYNSSSEADSKMEGNRIPNVMATEFMLTKRSLIWVQALSMVARNMLTRKRFSADLGPRPEKKQRLAFFWLPQGWARVHCTPCAPYCYANALH